MDRFYEYPAFVTVRVYKYPAFVTVRAKSLKEARIVLEKALEELGNTIVDAELGVDIAIDEGEPEDVTDEA